MTDTGRNILLSPLDWGLGHAARCVPLIRDFLSKGKSVTVFASPLLNHYLRSRFPQIKYIDDSTEPISYGLKGFDFFELVHVARLMKSRSKTERKLCEELCLQGQFDLVVSDNRYGFYSDNVKSVLVTHQLLPVPPRLLKIGMPLLQRFLNKTFLRFAEVWVPDLAKPPGLAGVLSHPKTVLSNVKYIGLLSRFSGKKCTSETRKAGSILVITSGPAEHRLQMADLFSAELSDRGHRILIAGIRFQTTHSDVSCYESPSDEELFCLMAESEIIVTHSGYSSVMDLFTIGRSAVLIPTYGQTEQEYLAEIHSDKFIVGTDFNELFELFDNRTELIAKLSDKEKVLRGDLC